MLIMINFLVINITLFIESYSLHNILNVLLMLVFLICISYVSFHNMIDSFIHDCNKSKKNGFLSSFILLYAYL